MYTLKSEASTGPLRIQAALVHLSAAERKHNVRRLAARLGYEGFTEKEYTDQLRNHTGIDRPTLMRNTNYERSLIERRLYRAVAEKRISGLSIRETAKSLGITKRPVERVEEFRKSSIIRPLPDDVWTLAEALDIATRIYIDKNSAFDWAHDLKLDEDGNYILEEGWFHHPMEDDVVCIPFDRMERMRNNLEKLHANWASDARANWPYLLANFTFDSIADGLLSRIDELCEMTPEQVADLLPDESASQGLTREERLDYRCEISRGFCSRYFLSRRNALTGAKSCAEDRQFHEKETKACVPYSQSSLVIPEDQQPINRDFNDDELDATPAVNPAPIVIKQDASNSLHELTRALQKLKSSIDRGGVTINEIMQHLARPEHDELLDLVRSL